MMTRAVTHIEISEANRGKLSERWQRVAMMQAAGIAQSWLSHRARRYREYEQKRYYYEQRRANDVKTAGKFPIWCEPKLPLLKQSRIQANGNVVALEVPNTDELTPNRHKPKPTQQALRTREA